MNIPIKVKLNLTQTHTHTYISAWQGEKNGRVIEATLYNGLDLFDIPESFTATVDGVIDNQVVASKESCEIRDNKIYIPLTEYMCVTSGELKLVVNLTEGEALVCCQIIKVKIQKAIIYVDDSRLFCALVYFAIFCFFQQFKVTVEAKKHCFGFFNGCI